MEYLSMVANGELFAVDATLVERVVRNISYTPIPAAPGAVAGIANMKGGIVTLLCFSKLLGYSRSEQAVHAVIFKPLTNGNDQMGLLIDKPGELISIDDSDINRSRHEGNADATSLISGLAEKNNNLYRIIALSEATHPKNN